MQSVLPAVTIRPQSPADRQTERCFQATQHCKLQLHAALLFIHLFIYSTISTTDVCKTYLMSHSGALGNLCSSIGRRNQTTEIIFWKRKQENDPKNQN